jgi:hypothetical protein
MKNTIILTNVRNDLIINSDICDSINRINHRMHFIKFESKFERVIVVRMEEEIYDEIN